MRHAVKVVIVCDHCNLANIVYLEPDRNAVAEKLVCLCKRQIRLQIHRVYGNDNGA